MKVSAHFSELFICFGVHIGGLDIGHDLKQTPRENSPNLTQE